MPRLTGARLPADCKPRERQLQPPGLHRPARGQLQLRGEHRRRQLHARARRLHGPCRPQLPAERHGAVAVRIRRLHRAAVSRVQSERPFATARAAGSSSAARTLARSTTDRAPPISSPRCRPRSAPSAAAPIRSNNFASMATYDDGSCIPTPPLPPAAAAGPAAAPRRLRRRRSHRPHSTLCGKRSAPAAGWRHKASTIHVPGTVSRDDCAAACDESNECVAFAGGCNATTTTSAPTLTPAGATAAPANLSAELSALPQPTRWRWGRPMRGRGSTATPSASNAGQGERVVRRLLPAAGGEAGPARIWLEGSERRLDAHSGGWRRRQRPHVWLEASGGYGRPRRAGLHGAGGDQRLDRHAVWRMHHPARRVHRLLRRQLRGRRDRGSAPYCDRRLSTAAPIRRPQLQSERDALELQVPRAVRRGVQRQRRELRARPQPSPSRTASRRRSSAAGSAPTTSLAAPTARRQLPRRDKLGAAAYDDFPGCTDATARNHRADATRDDDSCIYWPRAGCTISTSPTTTSSGRRRGAAATILWWRVAARLRRLDGAKLIHATVHSSSACSTRCSGVWRRSRSITTRWPNATTAAASWARRRPAAPSPPPSPPGRRRRRALPGMWEAEGTHHNPPSPPPPPPPPSPSPPSPPVIPFDDVAEPNRTAAASFEAAVEQAANDFIKDVESADSISFYSLVGFGGLVLLGCCCICVCCSRKARGAIASCCRGIAGLAKPAPPRVLPPAQKEEAMAAARLVRAVRAERELSRATTPGVVEQLSGAATTLAAAAGPAGRRAAVWQRPAPASPVAAQGRGAAGGR